MGYLKIKTPDEPEIPAYVSIMHKIDRTTYKHKRDVMLVMSDRAIHTFDAKKGKLKFSLPFTELKGVSVSELFDGLCVLHTSGELKGDKGDMLFDTPHVIEFIVHLNRELVLTKQ